MSDRFHSALKTNVARDFTEGGIHFKQVTLQHSKDRVTETLHACPRMYTTSGIQLTDFLTFLGFARSDCPFHRGECYCREIPSAIDTVGMGKAVATAFGPLSNAAHALQACGLTVNQSEGWGYFFGKPSERRRTSYVSGDGHTAAKIERLKESQDEFFRYVFTWIDTGTTKGWTTHYRANHMPLSVEFHAALDFLGGFSWFGECPEYDFEGCWWRFTPYQTRGDDRVRNNPLVDAAHRNFDAHATQFAKGLRLFLSAHADLEPFGISFLRAPSPIPAPVSSPRQVPRAGARTSSARPSQPAMPPRFDVALSFAGMERRLAEDLAKRVRDAGFEVFYDEFYPEQLWGKDLVVFFDNIYRKASRYCVMFVSREYADRMWTTHERRSAQARAVEERGSEYILPIRVDNTELEGLLPTLGFLSLDQYAIPRIADMLIAKLRTPSTPRN